MNYQGENHIPTRARQATVYKQAASPNSLILMMLPSWVLKRLHTYNKLREHQGSTVFILVKEFVFKMSSKERKI